MFRDDLKHWCSSMELPNASCQLGKVERDLALSLIVSFVGDVLRIWLYFGISAKIVFWLTATTTVMTLELYLAQFVFL